MSDSHGKLNNKTAVRVTLILLRFVTTPTRCLNWRGVLFFAKKLRSCNRSTLNKFQPSAPHSEAESYRRKAAQCMAGPRAVDK